MELKKNDNIPNVIKLPPTLPKDPVCSGQEIICKKKSLQNNLNCIKSSNSNNSIAINTQCELIHPIITLDPLSESTNIGAKNTNNIDKEKNEVMNCDIVDIKKKDVVLQPKFNESEHEKNKYGKSSSKMISCKHINKVKKVFHKYRRDNYLNKGIRKYLKNKLKNRNKLENKVYSETISFLSRSKILKKVTAKESLIENQQVNEPCNYSSNRLRPPIDTSLGNLSQETLMMKRSTTSSENPELFDSDSIRSVIHVVPILPYKTEIINVSIAQVSSNTYFNSIKHEPALETIKILSHKTFSLDEGLTSSINIEDSNQLTSQPPSNKSSALESSKNISDFDFISIETSESTLIDGEKNSTNVESEDDFTFYNAKTSSDFKQSSFDSACYTSNSEVIHFNSILPDSDFKESSANTNLFDIKRETVEAVINLGMLPEIIPSSCSNSNHSNFANNVIVTKKLVPKYSDHNNIGQKDKDQLHLRNVLSKKIVGKPFVVENNVRFQKHLNLPSGEVIKQVLNDKQEKKLPSEGIDNECPKNFSELWDSLLVALDSTANRIEKTLSEKIIKELHKTLGTYEKNELNETDLESGKLSPENMRISQPGTRNISKKKDFKDIISENDQSLQCNLVQSEISDLLSSKTASVNVKVGLPGHSRNSLKILKEPPHLKENFEILKPAVEHGTDKEITHNKDNVTTDSSDAHYFSEGKNIGFYHLRTMVHDCSNYVKKNACVLTSVPSFFFILVFLYGLIVLILKFL